MDVVNKSGIELLVFVICMIYGIRLVVTKDVGIIRKQDKDTVKHPEEYAIHAGYIVIFLGVATLIMAGLNFVNVYAATIEIFCAVIIMGILWKRMHDKYN